MDILFIPCGGVYTIDYKRAGEVVHQIEPKVIIPMHFFTQGLNKEVFGQLSTVEPFLKEIGFPVERVEKLKIEKTQLDEEQRVYLLEPKG